jgi:nucleotide-binding universal stress UspA family protein
MTMYRKILVPLDGSPFAEHALPMALALARRSGAGIHLATVSTPLAAAYLEGVYVGNADLEEEKNAQLRAYQETILARMRERIEVPLSGEVKYGEVAATLCDLAASGEYDLIVMATHGRSPFGRFWLGSVADEMIRHGTLPLLLVRPGEHGEEEPNLKEEPDLGRVVIPLDGTELAEQILEPAVALAGLMPGAEIVLVRAIRPMTPIDLTPNVLGLGSEAEHVMDKVQEMQAMLYRDAESYLHNIARRLMMRGLKVRVHVVVEEKPAEAIIHEADDEQAGLIALETHGRGSLSRLFHGSTTDKVVRGAHVPILVHRPVTA